MTWKIKLTLMTIVFGSISPSTGSANTTDFKLSVAIDLGTYYSGYAVLAKEDFRNDPAKFINTSLRIPTTILLNPQKEFRAFGFDAENEYLKLASGNQHRDWYYVRKFKARLYSERVGMKLVVNKLITCSPWEFG